jgi:Zn-finger protein
MNNKNLNNKNKENKFKDYKNCNWKWKEPNKNKILKKVLILHQWLKKVMKLKKVKNNGLNLVA